MTAATQSSQGMNDRLARHFVRRLRREAKRRAVDAAVEAGLLREEFVDSSGRVLQVFHRGEALPAAASGKQAAAMLARRRRRLVDETSHSVPGDLFVEEDQPQPSTSASESANSGGPVSFEGSTPAAEIVGAVRAAAEPPRASEVACLLLVAQAVTNAEYAERQALDVLRLQQPIVAIHCGTRHFETCFLALLGRGLILPGEVSRCNGYGLERRDSFYFPTMDGAKWQVVCFTGKDRLDKDDGWCVGLAAQGSYPILLVSERDRWVPARLAAAAQLKLDCGDLNADIVKRTIEAVLGGPPVEELDDIDFRKLDLVDLSIAIRPGSTPSSAVATLRTLVAEADVEPSGDEGGTAISGNPRESNSASSGSSLSSRRGEDHVSGSRIVQPRKLSGTNSDRFIERIETFSGCDEARDWALSLVVDLPLWQAGDLHWEEMNTKLLLSGPPGTGKTLFARSLCNSLQVPMFTTSVSTWLEPSHLGDVVRRIKRSFTQAVAHQPAILFIDEVDGIGRRTDFTRDYADYWNALVNCLLELLDGAARTTGVIVVGATNHPAVIDPALLRSGRLSPHMKISPPDVAARMGILRHHLGDDLDSIIATAPKPTALQSEDDLRSFLHTLPDAVLRDLAANGIEDLAWKGTP